MGLPTEYFTSKRYDHFATGVELNYGRTGTYRSEVLLHFRDDGGVLGSASGVGDQIVVLHRVGSEVKEQGGDLFPGNSQVIPKGIIS